MKKDTYESIYLAEALYQEALADKHSDYSAADGLFVSWHRKAIKRSGATSPKDQERQQAGSKPNHKRTGKEPCE